MNDYKYRLQFVYSDGTDDFDYWDEIETFDNCYKTPKTLVEVFIKLVRSHPQIESYSITDRSNTSKSAYKGIYQFIKGNFEEPERSDLMRKVRDVTTVDCEAFNEYFTGTNMLSPEPREDPKENPIIDVLEWIIGALDCQVNLLGDRVKSLIERLREVLGDKRMEEQNSKEYQEYLRLKEKFEGK